jgi:hypothetical protein
VGGRVAEAPAPAAVVPRRPAVAKTNTLHDRISLKKTPTNYHHHLFSNIKIYLLYDSNSCSSQSCREFNYIYFKHQA